MKQPPKNDGGPTLGGVDPSSHPKMTVQGNRSATAQDQQEKPSLRTRRRRRSWAISRACHYLRAGDASLRHHAALFLAALRRRKAVRP